ncbi:MAG TPA: hypothetical protein VMT24_01165, partial [Aggregatilineaceae bacterium]|nr:hypothetical protein [Aggregatilineaceae bacterium]
EGLVNRLKGRDRAARIVDLYRDQGDHRAPSQMGFEMVRRLPDGSEETETVIVQDLLDEAAELVACEPYCVGCPANRTATPFGCVGTINYPISSAAERWLLDQLPGHDHPLVFMLLQKALREMGYTGESAVPLRAQRGAFLESPEPLERDLDGVPVTGDQVFELLFLSGPVRPAHGALLLQFFGGISPDLEADIMMWLAIPPSQAWIDEHIPFLHASRASDDASIASLKEFFRALHIAYRLGVPVLLDV